MLHQTLILTIIIIIIIIIIIKYNKQVLDNSHLLQQTIIFLLPLCGLSSKQWGVCCFFPILKRAKQKQNKTKQNKTKQNKTKQNKTKQNKTKQKTQKTWTK